MTKWNRRKEIAGWETRTIGKNWHRSISIKVYQKTQNFPKLFETILWIISTDRPRGSGLWLFHHFFQSFCVQNDSKIEMESRTPGNVLHYEGKKVVRMMCPTLGRGNLKSSVSRQLIQIFSPQKPIVCMCLSGVNTSMSATQLVEDLFIKVCATSIMKSL